MSDAVHGVRRVDGTGVLRPLHPASPQEVKGQFDQVLQKEVSRQQEVRFSNHALDRLRARNIQLTSSDVSILNGAVQQVADKGGQDSLVLMRDIAFVVNVPSRTVVTALDNVHLHQNVFTQIDSAIII